MHDGQQPPSTADGRERASDLAALQVAKIHVTFFKNEFAKTLTTDQLTLSELAERVLNASARSKDKLPWLKLAVFGTTRTDKGCLRNDTNVEQIAGCEIDYDYEEVGFDAAAEVLKRLGIAALIYTSPTHTPDKPRWRILAPTSKLCPNEMRAKLVARLNGAMKARLNGEKIAKGESFALSQSFFYGWVMNKLNLDHRAEVVAGTFIDLADDLGKFEDDGWPLSATSDDQKKVSSISGEARQRPGNSDIDWAKVAEHAGWLKSATGLPTDFSAKGKLIVGHTGNLDDLKFDLAQADLVSKPYQSWSEVGFALAAIFKNDGRYTNEEIAAALLCDLPCNRHALKQSDPHRAVERLISRSYQQADINAKKVRPAGEPEWRERRENGSPIPSMENARLAVTAIGVTCSLDLFHSKMLIDSTDMTIKGEVTDNIVMTLRRLMSDQFGFDLTERHVRDAVISLALERQFDPVCDMLAEAENNWDGVRRLDRMAADHLNCEDTPLNAMFVRKMMIAATARARHPGIKFDTISTFESAEGFNKSSSWKVLAGEDNFSDESIIGKATQAVQETLAACWIHENSELHGMKKAEIEHVKAFASRTSDDCRPAYGHFLKKQKRHSIEVGTTNNDQYLQSQTGNRRFWPMVVIKSIDLEKLKADRLQLWGEAAHYQSQGESIVLPENMWADAGIEQDARRIDDAWEDALSDIGPEVTVKYLDKDTGGVVEKSITITFNVLYENPPQIRIAAAAIFEHVLRISIAQQTTAVTMRLSTVMKKLGWQRTKNGLLTIGGKRVKGYFKPLPLKEATKF